MESINLKNDNIDHNNISLDSNMNTNIDNINLVSQNNNEPSVSNIGLELLMNDNKKRDETPRNRGGGRPRALIATRRVVRHHANSGVVRPIGSPFGRSACCCR